MKIVVLVKQVPDTWGDRTLDPETWLLDRDASDRVCDEINERALEVALRQKDADKSVDVVLLTMGPAPAADVLRKGLAMGADSAIHVLDATLAGADVARTAAVLSAALSGAGFDLIIAGNESTDGRGGVIPAMVAEHLGLPHLTQLREVDVADGVVTGVRATESGSMKLRSALPAVVSVTETVAEARFPSFKGVLTAKRKPLTTLTSAQLGLEGAGMGRSVVVSATKRPPRVAGSRITDDGTAGSQLADFLAERHLI